VYIGIVIERGLSVYTGTAIGIERERRIQRHCFIGSVECLLRHRYR